MVSQYLMWLLLLPVCRWTAEALQKYMKSTRSEAPYLPSNIQYIANNNALDSKEDVSLVSCSLLSLRCCCLLHVGFRVEGLGCCTDYQHTLSDTCSQYPSVLTNFSM
jgi:hypothetical protein